MHAKRVNENIPHLEMIEVVLIPMSSSAAGHTGLWSIKARVTFAFQLNFKVITSCRAHQRVKARETWVF